VDHKLKGTQPLKARMQYSECRIQNNSTSPPKKSNPTPTRSSSIYFRI
jgi:hypothetical protein